MTQSDQHAFTLGDAIVHPDRGQIRCSGGLADVEPKAMAVLVYLAKNAHKVVSTDELITHIWQGRPMGDNPVYKCITKLRKALEDDIHEPRFIATVPKKGYRLLVSPLAMDEDYSPTPQSVKFQRNLVIAALALVLVAVLIYRLNMDTLPEAPLGNGSVAVLEFADLEGDPNYPDLGTGVGEEIRIQLSRIDGLTVTSRNASVALHGTNPNPTPSEIRATLKVAYALEGTVRVIDGLIHYTAQLMDTGTGYEVWAASDTREYGAILDIQDEIADAVVDALRVKLARNLKTPVRSTNSVEAYEEFRLGQSLLARPFEPEILKTAEEHFQKALELDPAYARAYAGMCQVKRRWFRRNGNVIQFDQAEAACQRAAEIDPELSEVPLALGHLYRDRGRYEQAVTNYEKAIALNANELESYQGLAYTYAAMEKPQRAEELFRQAAALFPHVAAAHSRFAVFLFRQGRYKEALPEYQTAFALGRTGTTTLNSIAASYFMLGDFEMAVRYWNDSLTNKRTPAAHTNLGTAYYYLGRYADAVMQYRQAIELASTDYALWCGLVAGLRQLPGRAEEVTQTCKKAVELGQEELSVNPKDAMVMSRIASCMALLGDIPGARAAVIQAAELAPNDPNVLFNCAVAAVDSGDLELAMSMAERALEAGYPENHIWITPELGPIAEKLRNLPK